MPIEMNNTRQILHQSQQKQITQTLKAHPTAIKLFIGQHSRHTESYGKRNIFCPSPATSFLSATIDSWFKLYPTPHI